MKKVFTILCALLLALVSCNKETTVDYTGTSASGIVFNLSATHPDATKAVKTTWETGDVIFVFFSTQAAPKYAEMKWNGTSWVTTSKNSLELVDNASGTMRAIYLPFGSNATVSADGTNFTFSTTDNTYYLTDTQSFTVTSGVVSGTFNMQIPEGFVQFFLDDESASSSTEMELREPHLTPQGIASVAADGTITHTSIAHGAPLKGYVYDKESKVSGEKKGYLFSGILAESARNTSTAYHFTLVSGGWQGSYQSQDFSDKTLYTAANAGRAVNLPKTGWTEINDYKPIDLSFDLKGKRVYWCSRNVGASRDFPAENSNEARKATWGDYHAWGEVEPYYQDGHAYDGGSGIWKPGKTGYNLASYQWWNDTGNYFNRYGAIDSYSILLPTDDAAQTHLHGPWRMPEYEEWEALESACDWSWDGTNRGRVVTVKGGTAWTSPTIFLPAAGYRTSDSIPISNSGKYWSSSRASSEALAKGVYFDAEEPSQASDWLRYNSDNRYYGYSIRAVME